MHNNKEKPTEFEDIVAWIRFEDIGNVAQIGYAAKHEKYGLCFAPKCATFVVKWEQVIKWDYMKEVLPGYTLFSKQYQTQL